MIRVNLLQNRGSSARTQATGMTSGSTGTEFAYGSGVGTNATGVMSQVNKAVIINLIVLLLFPAALIYYERYNIAELKVQATALANQVSEAQATMQGKQAEIAQSAALKEKAQELATKIGLLKSLARTRLREIKTLDFIQTNLPEKVWLREVSFKSGDLMLRGYAVTDDDLTAFIRALEKNRSFANVILLQAREEKTREGTAKNFEISGKVEAE
jgi:Tfp pilus assembly protein PilN